MHARVIESYPSLASCTIAVTIVSIIYLHNSCVLLLIVSVLSAKSVKLFIHYSE